MKLKRSLATGAAIVIAGFSLTACGGDDNGGGSDGGGGGGGDASDAGDAPDNASTEDFCGVWNDDTIGGADSDSADQQADAAHEAADQLAGVGTPEDIDESQRNGFVVFVDFLAGVDAADIEKFDSANPTDPGAFAETLGIDEGEAEDVIAFITYAATTCAELPTDPTESPS